MSLQAEKLASVLDTLVVDATGDAVLAMAHHARHLFEHGGEFSVDSWRRECSLRIAAQKSTLLSSVYGARLPAYVWEPVEGAREILSGDRCSLQETEGAARLLLRHEDGMHVCMHGRLGQALVLDTGDPLHEDCHHVRALTMAFLNREANQQIAELLRSFTPTGSYEEVAAEALAYYDAL